MKIACKILVLGLLAALLLTGCGKGAPETSEPDYSKLIVPPVDLAITDYVTEQQLTTVLGYPMHLLGVYEEGVQSVYLSEDGSCQVTIHMMNQTRAGFDAQVVAATVPLTMQEGLGEVAYWYEGKTQLIVFSDGYALDVAISCADTPEVDTQTRQIAELILTKLAER